MPTDDLDLDDEREFAWLLVREDTLLKTLLEVWRAVPTDQGPKAARALAILLNGACLLFCVVVFVALFLLAILLIVQAPVMLFLLIDPVLPTWLAWTLVGVAGFGVLLALGGEVKEWLSKDSDAPGPAASPGAGWQPDQSLNVSHQSSRAITFAVYVLMLGWLIEASIILAGERCFTGATDRFWAWVLYFSHLTIDTILLGIPSTVIATWSDIEPTHWLGRCLAVLVQLCIAAGALGTLGSVMASTFRPRELFNGTVRQLADHLENIDVSDDDQLTIHRVAVVRPLKEREVLTLSKGEFFARVTGPVAGSAPSE